MMNEQNPKGYSQIIIVGLLLAVVILSRLIPHLDNFTATMAVALFSGAYFYKKSISLILPLAVLFITDAILQFQFLQGVRTFPGFYAGMPFTYLALLVAVAMGWQLKGNVRMGNTFIASIGMSIAFFIISNFGVWMSSGMYTKDLEGFISCFTMAVPFFRNTLVGDLIFVAILFGGFELINSLFVDKAYNHINRK